MNLLECLSFISLKVSETVRLPGSVAKGNGNHN